MILKGFRFGMLLQIAIGPVCLYIFKTATESGFLPAEAGVIAATLMDAVFVTLAILGVGSLLDKPGMKLALKYCGAVILVYFGAGTILGSLDISIIPTFRFIHPQAQIANAFITSFILTASSPLSILFWTGVFATKLSCEGYSRVEMKLFGVGAVLATLIFLSVFAFGVSLLHPLMNGQIIQALNILVGIILIGFGGKMLYTKSEGSATK